MQSWDEFYRLYRKLVYGFSKKAGLSHEEAEEVTNDVFLSVAKTIHDFESDPARGTFRGWLLNLTRWKVNDKFRCRPKDMGRPRNPEVTDQTGTIERIPDPNDGAPNWDSEWQSALLDAAMARVARRANAKHFQVFELCTRRGWSILKVAKEIGINPAAVYLIRHRLRAMLRVEIDDLKKRIN